jgi:hypothetical protein
MPMIYSSSLKSRQRISSKPRTDVGGLQYGLELVLLLSTRRFLESISIHPFDDVAVPHLGPAGWWAFG